MYTQAQLSAFRRQGYVVTDDGDLEHRAVYRQYYGAIEAGWIVHHLDSNKRNNNPQNLIALPEDFHLGLHAIQKHTRRKWTRLKIVLAYADSESRDKIKRLGAMQL